MVRISITTLLGLVLAVTAAAQEAELSAEAAARVDALIAELGSDSWEDRERATTDLIGFGVAATSRLIAAKEASDDVEVRRRISRILTETGGWAQDPDEIKVRVGEKLDLFRSQPAFQTYDRDPEQVWIQEGFQEVVAELSQMGPGIGKAIASAALEADSQVHRTNLTYLLGELKNREVGGTLVKLLSDPEPDVRSAAAFSLGKIGEIELDALRSAAQKDADAKVRVRAIVALGKGRQKQVVDWLIEFLTHPDPEVRQAANYTLNQATRQDHGFNAYYPESRRNRAVDKWKKWWGENKEGFDFPSRPEGDRRRANRFEAEVWIDGVPAAGAAAPAPVQIFERVEVEEVPDLEGPPAIEPPAVLEQPPEEVPEVPEDR